jgi:hypothetical protein
MRFFSQCLLLAAGLAIVPVALPQAQEVSLRVAGWNMESHESSDSLLREQMAAKQGIDLWGLSEVRDTQALSAFEVGAEGGEGADFEAVLGSTGGGDRLAIIFDTGILDLRGSEELTEMQDGNPSHRAALVAHFRGKRTGQEFKFMVNHLARGNDALRLEQAVFLNQWARAQQMPVMAVGDYNFDYHVQFGDQGERDPGFDAMTRDGTFIWVKPETLVKTQASDSFNSVLDFVFVANVVPGWTATSVILQREGDSVATSLDFDDDNEQTDHRPVDATFAVTIDVRDEDEPDDGDAVQRLSRTEILERLDQLEQAIEELRAAVDEP